MAKYKLSISTIVELNDELAIMQLQHNDELMDTINQAEAVFKAHGLTPTFEIQLA